MAWPTSAAAAACREFRWPSSVPTRRSYSSNPPRKRLLFLAKPSTRLACATSSSSSIAMNLLVEWCLPLVKVGGKLLAMKGAKVIEELAEADKIIPMLGGGLPQIHRVNLPGTEHHVIVEVPKVAHSDKTYPRPPTVAKKK